MDQVDPLSSPPRKLVDIAGLILFITVIVSWIGIGIFAHLKGDVKSLLLPKDSYGQRCGIDSLVRYKPYLYYFDITLCDGLTIPIVECHSTKVCVKNCPHETFLSSKDQVGGSKALICQRGSEVWNKTDCVSWYLPSISHNGRCLPQSVPNEEILEEISNIVQRPINARKMKKAIRNIKLSAEVTSGIEYLMREIIDNWWIILAAAILILFTCCGYFIIFSIIPKFLLIFSSISVPLTLGFFIYYGFSRYLFYKQQKNADDEVIYIKKNIWLTCSIMLSIAAFFLVFMTLFWIRDISRGIELVKICSNKIKDTLNMLFVATICWMLHIIFFISFVYVFLNLGNIAESASYKISMEHICVKYLSAFGTDIDVLACDPDFVKIRNHIINGTLCTGISCEVTARKKKEYLLLQFVNAVFYVWLIFFLLALQELVIGLFVYQWQTSLDDNSKYSVLVESQCILLVCKYHLGTAFIGSMMIALFKYLCLKIILIWTAKKSSSSEAISRINCCFQICSHVQKIYAIIDTQVLVVCVIYNKSFFTGSKIYKKLGRSESLKKIKPFGAIYYTVFCQKLLVTLCCTCIAYIYVKYLQADTPMAYNFLIILSTLYLTYATGSFIFGVYTVKLDAILVCLLKALEENTLITEGNLKFASEMLID